MIYDPVDEIISVSGLIGGGGRRNPDPPDPPPGSATVTKFHSTSSYL